MLRVVKAERLRELLSYDPDSGIFRWRVCARRKLVGSIAGHKGKQGYMHIGIDGRDYRAHRLVWLYVYGKWPPTEIDHINLLRHDNRLANLRLASREQNSANAPSHRDSSSGLKGVSFHKHMRKWRAEIMGDYILDNGSHKL